MPEVAAVPGRASAQAAESSPAWWLPAQPMVCVPNWQLSKLFSLEMHQTRQLMTQTEKQGMKHKIFSVLGAEG